MKRLIIISALMLALFSCGTKDKSEKPPEKASATPKIEEGKKVEVRKITPQNINGKTFFNAVVQAQKDIAITAKATGEVIQVHFDLGKFVKKGDLLVVIENDRQRTLLNQAKLSLEQAELNHELKQKLFAREKKLFEQKVISQEAYDLSENSYKTTELLLDQSKASVETAQINYNNCFVKAPFSGVIVTRLAQKGEYVAMGSAIARLVDTKNLQVIVGLTHIDLLKYKKNQHKDVEIILSDKSVLRGKIRGVAEAPDKQTSLYSMKILFESKKDTKTKKRLVFPGMQLTVALRGEEHKNSFKISRNSMKFIKNQYFIFIAEDGKAIKKEIEIITDIARMNIARFTDGSTKAVNMITTGIDALTDGKKIEIVKEQ